jgi:excisionase family DNA binding protein
MNKHAGSASGSDNATSAAVGVRSTSMLRVEDVAARWDLNVKTIYGMIERGELAARRFGRVLRIPRQLVESLEQASVAPERDIRCR